MKAKVKRGAGFRGVLDYSMDKDKEHELIESNMDGKNPRELSSEFGASRQLRSDCKKPVWHCSLSSPEGEKLSNEEWAAVAKDHLKNMKIDTDKHQYAVIKHNDTDYEHIHIVASRISLNGELWHGKHDVYKAIKSTQELEKKYDLTRTPGQYEKYPNKKNISSNELNMAVRKEEAPNRLIIQGAVDQALKDKPSVDIFCERMKKAKIDVKINQSQKTGRVSGISFKREGVAFKGSEVGKEYSWVGLQKKGLDYEQNRDREKIDRNNAKADQRADRRVEKSAKRNVEPGGRNNLPVDKSTGKPDRVYNDDARRISGNTQEITGKNIKNRKLDSKESRNDRADNESINKNRADQQEPGKKVHENTIIKKPFNNSDRDRNGSGTELYIHKPQAEGKQHQMETRDKPAANRRTGEYKEMVEKVVDRERTIRSNIEAMRERKKHPDTPTSGENRKTLQTAIEKMRERKKEAKAEKELLTKNADGTKKTAIERLKARKELAKLEKNNKVKYRERARGKGDFER